MAKIIRKKRSKKLNKIKSNALTLACLFGIASTNIVQAQIPEIITTPAPSFTQTSFGDVNNPNAMAISFSKFSMNGAQWVIDDTLKNFFELSDFVETAEHYKYYTSNPNFIKMSDKNGVIHEISQDFIEEYGIGGSIPIRLTLSPINDQRWDDHYVDPNNYYYPPQGFYGNMIDFDKDGIVNIQTFYIPLKMQ